MNAVYGARWVCARAAMVLLTRNVNSRRCTEEGELRRKWPVSYVTVYFGRDRKLKISNFRLKFEIILWSTMRG